MSWVNLNDLYATKTELATKVPTSRTINGKALSSNVTLGASDIKLSDNTTLQSAWDSISQAETYEADGVKGIKVGRLVFMQVALSTSISHAWDATKLADIPASWEPVNEVTACVALQTPNDSGVIILVTHDKSVVVQGKNTNWRTGWIFSNFAYVAVE